MPNYYSINSLEPDPFTGEHMTPHAMKSIHREDILLWKKIRWLVENLPDIDLGEKPDGEGIVLSCHMLARAVGRLFNLCVADGCVLPLHEHMYEHSWLITDHGNIIDLYPIATIGGPIIIDGGSYFARNIYDKNEKVEEWSELFEEEWFENSVQEIERALEKLQLLL